LAKGEEGTEHLDGSRNEKPHLETALGLVIKGTAAPRPLKGLKKKVRWVKR